MEIDITPVVIALIAVFAPFTLAYAADVWRRIATIKVLNVYEIDDIATRVVKAAEQVFTAEEKAEKKAMAMAYLEKTAAAYGLKLSAAELETAIEAAVYNFKNKAE